MRAMILERPGEPLSAADVAVPEPEEGQVQLRVRACAVCRTDLHIVDGELRDPRFPLILVHQMVGTVYRIGGNVSGFGVGDGVGVGVAGAGGGRNWTRR